VSKNIFDITAIMTGHGEGIFAGPSMVSFEDTISNATAAHLSVESIIVLDRPNAATKRQFAGVEARGHRLILSDGGDPAVARNAGVREARGRNVAFLDADDLWSDNWLVAAHEFCGDSPDLVAHCEIQILFGIYNCIVIHADSEAPEFDPQVLRATNYWDALCYARKEILLKFPYKQNDLKRGYGHEDWHWNCVTLDAGIAHRPVPGTVHFKRRRANSQQTMCAEEDVVTWPNPITSFDWHPRQRTRNGSSDNQSARFNGKR
jgi:glycosyltransferase involved in cell wall biosynthesis